MKKHNEHAAPREACGLFGVYDVPRATMLIYQGLFALQHRGQEGCGIAVSDGGCVRSSKGMGLVDSVLTRHTCAALPGHIGIGHVRYSTTGSNLPQNVQPLVVECSDGIWAIAHNGNLVNAGSLRRMYQEAGAIFQTSTDSEVLVHLLADPMFRNRPRRVARSLNELKGAFAFLIMTRDCVMAARDPFGFKPLSIGRLGKGYVFASETCALNQIGAEFIRDVRPGELVVADQTGLNSFAFADPSPEGLAQCVFEHVYFARPDSVVFGYNVHDIRCKLGLRLAQEYPVEADVVIAVPDSGNSAALGFARGSGIPLDYGFIRNHYIGRTFIMPKSGQRADSVDLKLAVVADVVRGKRVVVVDDSIVRGTTSRRRVSTLRAAGAREIHMRISSPPAAFPCFFGIDFATKTELIAAGKDTAEICKFIGADSLAYLSLEGLMSPFKNASDFCASCFCGKYKIDVSGVEGKEGLEKNSSVLSLNIPV
ncbi:MAG: amidophosphoribosyltransferase [Kiritimatiellae bacterium]|nr:amidophosphoribosyltransferase [Kiritimatiellia bacterium]